MDDVCIWQFTYGCTEKHDKERKDISENINDVKYVTKAFGNLDAKAVIHFILFSTSSDIGKFESSKDDKVFATMGLGTHRAHCCEKANSTRT